MIIPACPTNDPCQRKYSYTCTLVGTVRCHDSSSETYTTSSHPTFLTYSHLHKPRLSHSE